MYIFIFEDGETKKSKVISDEDLNSVDDGYLQIIRIKDMAEYCDGEWNKLESV